MPPTQKQRVIVETSEGKEAIITPILPDDVIINRHDLERMEHLHEGIEAALQIAEIFSADIMKIINQAKR